jgi:hypothetical protein
LNIELWRTPSPRAAKIYALNSQLTNNVVFVGVLFKVSHRQPHESKCRYIDKLWGDNPGPGDVRLLDAIVMIQSKAGQEGPTERDLTDAWDTSVVASLVTRADLDAANARRPPAS